MIFHFNHCAEEGKGAQKTLQDETFFQPGKITA
jgi:hypothetical protein